PDRLVRDIERRLGGAFLLGGARGPRRPAARGRDLRLGPAALDLRRDRDLRRPRPPRLWTGDPPPPLLGADRAHPLRPGLLRPGLPQPWAGRRPPRLAHPHRRLVRAFARPILRLEAAAERAGR